MTTEGANPSPTCGRRWPREARSDEGRWEGGSAVDLTQAPDGALLFAEDGNGTLWRVSFGGK